MWQQRFELALSLLALVAVAWVLAQASTAFVSLATGWDLPRGWGPKSGLFPTVIGVPVLALALAQLLVALRGVIQWAPGGTNVHEEDPPSEGEASSLEELSLPREVVARRTAVIIATIVGFAVGIWLLGFITAVPLVTFLYLKVAAGESWTLSVGLSGGAGAFFYFVFVRTLGVPAAHGPLLAPFLG